MKNLRSLLLILVLTLLSAAPPAIASPFGGGPPGPMTALAGLEGIPAAARAKIDPELLEQLLEAEAALPRGLAAAARPKPVTYLVYLHERASLQGLDRVPSLEGRRELLVQRLQATASHSQAGIVALLDTSLHEGRITRYKAYWIFNGLAVDGDLATAVALALRPEVE